MKRLFTLVTIIVLAVISGNSIGACPRADITGNCKVNLEDFAIMASEWLVEGIPEDPAVMLWVSINDSGAGMKDSAGNPINEGGFTGEMSKYETTNAQYCQFLNEVLDSGDVVVDGNDINGADGPNTFWIYVGKRYYTLGGTGDTSDGATNGGATRISYNGISFTVDIGFENHPVTHVSWYGATVFCRFYNYRLPSEWEWQAVADYDGSYIYGCGVSINYSIANCYRSTHPDGTTIVGNIENASGYGYGVCDMAGNVWEWTRSLKNPASAQIYRVIRGGSWSVNALTCTVSRRHTYLPYDTNNSIGFRVCR